MINHIRTLLLNSNPGSRQSDQYPGEEFVPEDTRFRTLSGTTGEIWTLLFGGLDRAGINLFLRLGMGIISACDMDEFLYEEDTRKTVPPYNDIRFRQGPYRSVTWESDSDLDVRLSGPLEVNDVTFTEWMLTVESSSTATLANLTRSISYGPFSFSTAAGRSSWLDFPGTKSRISFVPIVGAKANLEIFTLPQRSLLERFNEIVTILDERKSFFVDTRLREIYENKSNLFRLSATLIQLGKQIGFITVRE